MIEELLHQIMDAGAYVWKYVGVIQQAVNCCLEQARLCIENCEMTLENQDAYILGAQCRKIHSVMW
jgi:hypothetical protein